jgi:hypothetical protein
MGVPSEIKYENDDVILSVDKYNYIVDIKSRHSNKILKTHYYGQFDTMLNELLHTDLIHKAEVKEVIEKVKKPNE